jgi:HNH endonuclease
MPPKPRPLIERFNESFSVDDKTGCWNWIGAIRTTGYGVIKRGSRGLQAHRAAWEIFIGTIPDGMLILHSCDNQRCVNVAHLRVGTHLDNMRDMVERGRARKISWGTHCKRGHEFDEKNTYLYTRMYKGEEKPVRACRECYRIKKRERLQAALNRGRRNEK